MKKIVITIIVILSLTLIVQSAYYNLENSKINETNDINILINSAIDGEIENIPNNRVYIDKEPLNQWENVVVPNGIADFSSKYTGELKVVTVENALHKFVYEDAEKIHKQTTNRSNNYKTQYYDEHTEEINNMGIYSADDYKKISVQINLLNSNDKYKSSEIDTSSYAQTSDGYTRLKVTLTYTSNKKVKLYVYLANKESTMPNIKFSSGE